MLEKRSKKSCLLSLLWIVITLLGACDSVDREKAVLFDSSLTVEANIASNLITLENNNDFDKLDRFVKDKRIVILGEAGHWNGATFEVKVNWIKHLHKKYGFDVIAMEGLSPLPAYLLQLKDFQCPWNIVDIWSWAENKENQPLLSMIVSGQLFAVGIDLPSYYFTADSKNFTYPDVLQLAIKRIDTENICKIDWNRLIELYIKYLSFFNSGNGETNQYNTSDLAEMMNFFNQIEQYVALLSKKYGVDLQVIQQSLKNNKVEFQCGFYNIDPANIDLSTIHIANNYRDRQMADNLIWYLDRNPDKKVIVWCANFHGAKDISEIDYPQDSLLYYRTRLMGEHLADKYGDKLYSIAFTTSEPVTQNEPIGDLEKELAKGKYDYGFIDFTVLRRHPDYLGKKFNSSIIRRKNGRFHVTWDGVYYIRKEHLPIQQK